MEDRLNSIEKKIDLILEKLDHQEPAIASMKNHIHLVEEYVNIMPGANLCKRILSKFYWSTNNMVFHSVEQKQTSDRRQIMHEGDVFEGKREEN